MIETEPKVTFTEAVLLLPALLTVRKDGKSQKRKLHPSTLWRWARKGISGHRLEVARMGRRFVTSMPAIERFAAALASEEIPERPRPQASTAARQPACRKRAIAEAQERLKKAGI